jgi:hypothetical protein
VNIDVQPVLDKKAAINYVSKYASKPEVLSQSYLEKREMRIYEAEGDAQGGVARGGVRGAAERSMLVGFDLGCYENE